MALIKCPECGHDVSDKAGACPSCGCPIESVYAGNDDNVVWHEDENSTLEDTPREKWTDFIVGFRSGKPVHMVIAGLLYAGCIIMLITGNGTIFDRVLDVILVIGSIYLFSVFFASPAHVKRAFYALIGVVFIALGTIGRTLTGDNIANTTIPVDSTQQQTVYDTGTDTNTTSNTDANTGTTQIDNSTEDDGGAYGNYVTYEMFSQMSDGMTLYEIRNLTGQQGELMSSAGGIETWTFKGRGISNATVTFIDGKLSSKAQIGLE